MKVSYRFIAKMALLLVVIGFLMPVACDQNGFQIADYMMKNNKTIDGLLIYLMVISAAAGVFIGVLLLMRNKVRTSVDWLIIVVCIASGLIIYLGHLKDNVKLQTGAYMILAGWIAAVVFQLFSKVRKER